MADANGQNKLIVERLGEKIVNFRMEGSLAAERELGCIPLSKVQNDYTAPELFDASIQCMKQNNVNDANELYLVARAYSTFDALRVTDISARQAVTVLVMNFGQSLEALGKVEEFMQAFKQYRSNQEKKGDFCSQMKKIGSPSYYPNYMILHGIKAFIENPHKDALVKNFDSIITWQKIYIDSLKCDNFNK